MIVNNKFPLKFGVLFVLAKEDREMMVSEIYDELKPAFNEEKAFTKKNVRFHLDSMVGIGMVEMSNEHYDNNGQLVANYSITPFGVKRTELLPDEYRAHLT